MTLSTPKVAPNEGEKAAKKPETTVVTPESVKAGQGRAIDSQLANVEQRVNASQAERQMEESADLDSDSDMDTDSSSENSDTAITSPSTPEKDKKPKSWWVGLFGSLSAGFTSVSTWLGETGGKFGDWLGGLLGLKPKDDKKKSEAGSDADTDKDEDNDARYDTGDALDPDEKIPDDISHLLTVKSWEEVQAIPDLGQRVYQAALLAYAVNMDCFTKDGNHCSAWCDSVFNKAGLETVYNDASRIFSDYKTWPKKGTMQGLKLLPGDSIIRHNGNAATGYHQEIILSSEGPDSAGNYQIVTVGQLSVKGKSGNRKIRSLTVPAEKIKVVIRPGATKPWEGDGANLIA